MSASNNRLLASGLATCVALVGCAGAQPVRYADLASSARLDGRGQKGRG